MDTETTRHPDGTFNIVQSAPSTVTRTPDDLQHLYWRALRRATCGLVRFDRDAVRILGLWPALLRFGPMVDGSRPIVGGIFARQPHGAIRWLATGSQVIVAVESFSPLLRGPLWRSESWFHDVVGRRFLARAVIGD